jgi:hypothetical protein
MIKDAPHYVLRDVPVDQPGPESVPPLMRGEVNRAAVLVTDVAAVQPTIERHPVGRAGCGRGAVEVLGGPGKQARSAGGPALSRAVPLLAKQVAKLLVDGHQSLSFHLVVEVAQIRRAVGVGDHAVGRHSQRVGDT